MGRTFLGLIGSRRCAPSTPVNSRWTASLPSLVVDHRWLSRPVSLGRERPRTALIGPLRGTSFACRLPLCPPFLGLRPGREPSSTRPWQERFRGAGTCPVPRRNLPLPPCGRGIKGGVPTGPQRGPSNETSAGTSGPPCCQRRRLKGRQPGWSRHAPSTRALLPPRGRRVFALPLPRCGRGIEGEGAGRRSSCSAASMIVGGCRLTCAAGCSLTLR